MNKNLGFALVILVVVWGMGESRREEGTYLPETLDINGEFYGEQGDSGELKEAIREEVQTKTAEDFKKNGLSYNLPKSRASLTAKSLIANPLPEPVKETPKPKPIVQTNPI